MRHRALFTTLVGLAALLLAACGGGAQTAVDSTELLKGVSWQLNELNGNPTLPLPEAAVTANFGEDGRLTGNAGCNDYFASYETDGENISISALGWTEKFCMEPEGVMDQESQYLAALETADIFEIEAGVLEMRTSEGSLAVSYTRAQP